jgi:hypothetical protein
LTEWRFTPWLDEEGIIGVALNALDGQENVERVLLFEELRAAACGQNEMQQPDEVATPRLEMRHSNNMGKLTLYEC